MSGYDDRTMIILNPSETLVGFSTLTWLVEDEAITKPFEKALEKLQKAVAERLKDEAAELAKKAKDEDRDVENDDDEDDEEQEDDDVEEEDLDFLTSDDNSTFSVTASGDIFVSSDYNPFFLTGDEATVVRGSLKSTLVERVVSLNKLIEEL